MCFCVCVLFLFFVVVLLLLFYCCFCCCFVLFFQHKVLGMILNWVITTVPTDSKTFAFVSASTR